MSQPAVFVSLVSAAVAVLCSCDSSQQQQLPDSIVTHSACAPLSLTVPDAATSLQRDGMQQAAVSWNTLGFTRIAVGSSDEPITVHFQTAAALSHGFYDPDTGEVFINDGIDNFEEVAVVLAHELGHAMGLAHIAESERVSVMNPGNTVIPPTPADDALLRQGCN